MVRARDYLRQRTLKTYEFVPQHAVDIFRSIKPRWDKIDGTIFLRQDDQETRYSYGPTWSANSCGVDCTIFCAIVLDVGRIQVDQLDPGAASEVPVSAHVLGKMVKRHWGLLPVAKRNEMRDALRGSLSREDSTKFPPAPALLPVSEVLGHCLEGVPQVSFSMIKAHRCGDGLFHTSGRGTPQRYNSLYIAKFPVREGIQDILDSESITASHAGCDGPRPCPNNHTRHWLIVDRMPPTLIVQLPDGAKQGKAVQAALFDEMTVEWNTPYDTQTTAYYAVGAIIATGKAESTHFVSVWRACESFVLYDGMAKGGKARLIKDWAAIPGRRPRVVTLFFRICEGGCGDSQSDDEHGQSDQE